jgi:hypothetical protein
MPAKIEKQKEGGPFEECIKCFKETPYWWGDGCSPLCEECAATMLDTDVYEMSAELGFGPLPELKRFRRGSLFN